MLKQKIKQFLTLVLILAIKELKNNLMKNVLKNVSPVKKSTNKMLIA